MAASLGLVPWYNGGCVGCVYPFSQIFNHSPWLAHTHAVPFFHHSILKITVFLVSQLVEQSEHGRSVGALIQSGCMKSCLAAQNRFASLKGKGPLKKVKKSAEM